MLKGYDLAMNWECKHNSAHLCCAADGGSSSELSAELTAAVEAGVQRAVLQLGEQRALESTQAAGEQQAALAAALKVSSACLPVCLGLQV